MSNVKYDFVSDECTEDDLRHVMIEMRLLEIHRMYERKDPALFSELFGLLADDEIRDAYMTMVEREVRATTD